MTVTPSLIQRVRIRRFSSRPRSASWTRSLAPSVCITSSMTCAPTVRPGVAGDLDGVGQVVLALGVVVGELRQRLGEELGVEGEDPGVDLVDLALLGGGVLLLDDRLDVALVVADHPAVAERVRPATPDRMLTARCAASCSAANARRLSPSSSGVSPYATRTVPLVVPAPPPWPPGPRHRCPAGSPGRRARRRGRSAAMCAATCSRWWPTTATMRCGLAPPGPRSGRGRSCCARRRGAAPSWSWTSSGCRRPRPGRPPSARFAPGSPPWLVASL